MTISRSSRNRAFRSALACFLVLVARAPAAASPAEGDWPRWQTPEHAGFASHRLAEAQALWNGLQDSREAGLLVAFKGKVLVSYGATSAPYPSPTVRATFLSALYGTRVDTGDIDIQKTLEEVGINDSPPLTRAERRARVVDLLQARSGVYHAAACESSSMKSSRPARGSHPPGTYWYLNNWDVNALGTIYWRETGGEIFEEFDDRLARPLGMQDFEMDDCSYSWQMTYSWHACYWFRMSVRDRARLGQLFLQRGRWGNRQVLPEHWVDESTRKYSQTPEPGIGFGYMWWTLEPEFFARIFRDRRLLGLRGYAASDFGKQLILVVPDAEMVIVLASAAPAGRGFGMAQTFPMMERIVTAREIIDLAAVRSKAKPGKAGAGGSLRLAARIKNRSDSVSRPTQVDFYLSRQPDGDDEIRWIGGVSLAELEGRGRETVRLRASVPDDLAPGEYHLITTVDRDKANYDLRRDNNLSVSRQTIEIGG